MIAIKVLSTPDNIERLRTRGPEVITRLQTKMTSLMFQLMAKIVGEELPAMFPNGAPNIAATVRAVPATVEGTKIAGYVDAGGPKTTKRTLRGGYEVDYAAVQHEGISQPYVILPFNKQALAFMLDGKKIIRHWVWHPKLKARPFMTQGLADMQDQIVAELSAELTAIVNG